MPTTGLILAYDRLFWATYRPIPILMIPGTVEPEFEIAPAPLLDNFQYLMQASSPTRSPLLRIKNTGRSHLR